MHLLDMLATHVNMWDGLLRTIRATEHRINIENGVKAIGSMPYRKSPVRRAIAMAEIEKQLVARFIEPTTSEWASSVVVVLRKDWTLCFCVDYRKLSTLTRSDAYPLSRMRDCLN